MSAGFRVCQVSGKRGYPGRRKARLASRSTGNRVRLYLCPYCRLWHVTHEPKAREL